jgi:hypothetical protein
MALGIVDSIWTIEDLVRAALQQPHGEIAA